MLTKWNKYGMMFLYPERIQDMKEISHCVKRKQTKRKEGSQRDIYVIHKQLTGIKESKI